MTDEETKLASVAGYLDEASSVILSHLSDQFGSFKKAPDDHPLFKAIDALDHAKSYLPTEDEEEDEAA